jgi:hypothetical protein
MNSLSPPALARQALIVIVLVLVALPSQARRADEVYLLNGDRVTCDIKQLSRGRLRVKTDAMDTVYIDWDLIDRIATTKLMQVEMLDGQRRLGELGGVESRELLVIDDGETLSLPMAEVVNINRIKIDESFLDRLGGSLSAGVNYQQSSDVSASSVSGNVRYREEKFEITSSLSINNTTQAAAEGDRLRADLNGAYRRLLENRWFWTGFGSLERNDELGIDLRTLVGAGIGRFILQSNQRSWSVTAGVTGSVEDRAGQSGKLRGELLMSTDFQLFRFQTPKIDLTTSAKVYPSLSEDDRVRGNFDIKLRQELIVDLFWELSYFYTFDTKPPAAATSRSDTGIVTSLGYTF